MARRPASQPSTPTPPAHKLPPEPQPQPQPQPQPLLALKVAHWGAAVTGKLALTWAMRVLSTADATTPAAAGPIVTVAAGWLLLGERLVPLSALSVALSLLGSTLMQRPRAPPAAAAADSAGSGSLHLWWWVPWMSTGCFALTTVLGRLLAKRGVPAGTITAELSRALLVVYAALAAYDWLLWVPLSLTNLRMWALLLAIALLAALADYSSIKSQALARVALLAPFGVVRPLATAALAYAAFGELPEGGVWWLIGLAPAVAGMVIAGELMRAPAHAPASANAPAQPDKSR
jgi:drug/metabolite transporter (DMT)-like permease